MYPSIIPLSKKITQQKLLGYFLFMSHMIDSIFDENISLDDLYTPECHNCRYRIFIHLSFPYFSCLYIFSFSIESKSFFICVKHRTISYISFESKKFKYSYSFSFSFYCNRIEFTESKEVSNLFSSSLRDDNKHIVFFSSRLKS